MRALAISVLFIFVGETALAQPPVMEPGPKSPAESLAYVKARPGFKVELMAAEPVVMSPIAFAWGPDGKFWVVEMGDYPLGLDNQGKPGGRVKFLEKTKAEGPYDKATLFLDGLSYPTGVTPWGKGVLITCAPDIFYAEDTNGDGKADKKVVLFTGFKEGNPQHRVNGLTYGLDSWLYGANGDSGGVVKSLKTGKSLNISGRDFRIKPDEGLIEAVSGQSQFGRHRDDWGNWFGNNNSNPMYHYVLEDRYLKRNPHVLYPDVRVQVSETPGAARVYPISTALPRFNNPNSVNHFTSACSAIIYRDDFFGPEFIGNSFVAEPVHNLVHREIMARKGVTFTSKRAPDEQTSEFLASTDNWFRPTTIQTGPDGALWVADMYRYVIEHPEWIPKDWQKKLDLRAGQDKGRIYRVYPEGKKPREIPRLDKMDEVELVKALGSANGWTRDTAQQLLIAGKAKYAAAPIEGPEMLLTVMSRVNNPHMRLHVLCVLDGLGRADYSKVEAGMQDEHPGVRTNAIRIAEHLSFPGAWRSFEPVLARLLKDSDPLVRIQLAYMLESQFDAGQYLGQMLIDSRNDRYLSAAVLSSVNQNNWQLFSEAVLKSDSLPPSSQAALMKLVGVYFGPNSAVQFLTNWFKQNERKSKSEQLEQLANLLDTLEAGKTSLGQWAGGSLKSNEPIAHKIGALFASAQGILTDNGASTADKLVALRILGRQPQMWEQDRALLASLLVPQTEEALQLAAAQSLGRIVEQRTPGELLKRWKSYSPALRAQVAGVLVSRQEWTPLLLDAIEKKQVLPTELDAIRRQQLLQSKNSEVRQQAERLLAAASNPDRNKVVMEYVLRTPPQGNPDLGKKLFTKHCAACHQLGGIGQQVGPDLASVPDKSTEGLLTSILDPNRVVEARYVNYLATTKTGLTLSGVLFGETTTSITLVAADGKKHELLRRDLDDLASTGKSPMPEGLEKDIPPGDMADLLAFLRAAGPTLAPKKFDGNRPEPVKADAKGVLRLLPQNAAIYGKSLVLEKKHGNLGYWSSEDDHAIWTLDVPAAGTYAVELEWACADDSAGNVLTLQAGPKKLTHKVASTGTWDDYRVIWIATVELPQGRVEVTARSQGPIRGALIDLKGVYLVPKR